MDRLTQAALVRCLFGNPFWPSGMSPLWLAWNDGTVPRLASKSYDSRSLPTGHLDEERLTVLADALEEAGCTDDAILSHLRGPGPHVRGCWALDTVLGKT